MKEATSVKITVTPTDREWLDVAADLIRGKPASAAMRQAAARELHRLAYRAARAAARSERA